MGESRYINPYTDFGFKKLFEQAEIAQYTPEERREYEASVKDYWDYFSTMKTATDKAKAEGRAEGRTEGENKKAIEVARKMKADNMPVELIVKYTGLTAEEIEGL